MELWQTRELIAYWEEHPPVHLLLNELNDMVAALGGAKRPRRGSAKKGHKPSRAELEQLVAMVKGKR